MKCQRCAKRMKPPFWYYFYSMNEYTCPKCHTRFYLSEKKNLWWLVIGHLFYPLTTLLVAPLLCICLDVWSVLPETKNNVLFVGLVLVIWLSLYFLCFRSLYRSSEYKCVEDREADDDTDVYEWGDSVVEEEKPYKKLLRRILLNVLFLGFVFCTMLPYYMNSAFNQMVLPILVPTSTIKAIDYEYLEENIEILEEWGYVNITNNKVYKNYYWKTIHYTEDDHMRIYVYLYPEDKSKMNIRRSNYYSSWNDVFHKSNASSLDIDRGRFSFQFMIFDKQAYHEIRDEMEQIAQRIEEHKTKNNI